MLAMISLPNLFVPLLVGDFAPLLRQILRVSVCAGSVILLIITIVGISVCRRLRRTNPSDARGVKIEEAQPTEVCW